MHVYAATKNPGKLRELQAIFGGLGWTLEAFDGYAEPSEGDASYRDNAALKARALFAQLRAAGIARAVIGDDSGIEVAALAGRPGVRSARYGGDATWAQRRRLLLDELVASGSADRRARFVCALHFVAADGSELSVQEELAGELASAERGDGGFSYDAIFYYPPLAKTFGELSSHEKNEVSHRALAARALAARMAGGPAHGM